MAVGGSIEELHGRLGDALRVVGWYDGERTGIVYVREGLDRAAVEERIDAVREQLPWTWPPAEPASLRDTGEVDASLQIREGCAFAHFPLAERQGLLVSVESGVGADLGELITAPSDWLDADGFTLRGSGDGATRRCPECGSRNYAVKSSRPGRPRESEGTYQCRYCGATFDTPVLAESRLAVRDEE